MSFLETKLRFPPGKFTRDQLSLTVVGNLPAGSNIVDQVIVTFDNVRTRDEVKSAARHLAGTDRSTGVQLEAPDHLRSHYQAFQKLGFHIKKKHPALKRNVKFDDINKALVMDIRTSPEADWKTVLYSDAKNLLKRAKIDSSRLEKRELDSLVELAGTGNKTPENIVISDSDDDDAFADAVIIPDDNKTSNSSPRYLSFINTNARSLGPKISSLYDCLIEKDCDFAVVTETWYQSNRDCEDAMRYYQKKFSLGVIHSNRSICAANNRQYGGVALVYSQKTAKFENFPLINPLEHEVLAAVGKIVGIKGKVFCIACYAPPNLTPTRADELLEFLSDVIAEGKRRFPDCTLVLAGDFNKWHAEHVLQDHPDLTEIAHSPTRQDRAIDRSFVNFGRAITACGKLEPLKTEDGRKSDHRIAWAFASIKKEVGKTTSYSFREYTEAGARAFLSELLVQNWYPVYQAASPTLKVDKF